MPSLTIECEDLEGISPLIRDGIRGLVFTVHLSKRQYEALLGDTCDDVKARIGKEEAMELAESRGVRIAHS